MTKRAAVAFTLLASTFPNTGALRAAPAAPGGASQTPEKFEFCDIYYEGWGGRRRDFAKAFDCFRRHKMWLHVAIMQLNGEGTPVDVAGARASIRGLESKDADYEALDKIIGKREANPALKGPRVDFCKHVAMTTPSWNSCRADEESQKAQKDDAWLKKVRIGLESSTRPAFDAAKAAFDTFARAEGDRTYEDFSDGTARVQEATNQEALVRRNFLATIKMIVGGQVRQPARARSFRDADLELNVVYDETISPYAKFRSPTDAFKAKSRAAQHEWVRYRDAMGKLGAACAPGVADAEDRTRARVTEDRIRELRGK